MICVANWGHRLIGRYRNFGRGVMLFGRVKMFYFLTQSRLLVVGLASGLVCVFDIRSSRIIRAVQMAHRITALTVVGNGGSGRTQ